MKATEMSLRVKWFIYMTTEFYKFLFFNALFVTVNSVLYLLSRILILFFSIVLSLKGLFIQSVF